MKINTTEKKEVIRRFNIIKGQIEGVIKMIDAEEDCLSIITQMKAAKSGFNRLGETFIKQYLIECSQKEKNAFEAKSFEKPCACFPITNQNFMYRMNVEHWHLNRWIYLIAGEWL
ncbi:metal-sensitive transcriptional regulator [Candidatus Peregrinibacteria bacterium]|nr:MAG: metal-sensitive transcriptional regulator [Candidatus Peregrinibacteria bacterium]